MVFVGPSGCGKTTALRMVAGTRGDQRGRDPDRRPRRQRDLPEGPRHRDGVPELRALPAHDRRAEPRLRPEAPQARARPRSTAASGPPRRALDLEEQLERKPRALSGGQRQRVALGRAIVREPAAFLMDEPLSNLDAALRAQTRAEILKLQKHLGTTTIYVTHDQVEAMTMGDRIAVMKKGVLQQIGTPEELYTRPANVFVATFIGSPSMNVVPAGAIGIGGDGQLTGFRPEHISPGAADGRIDRLRGDDRRRRIPRRRAARPPPARQARTRREAPGRAAPHPRRARVVHRPAPLDRTLRRRDRRGDRSRPVPSDPVRIPTENRGQPARSTPRGTDSRTRFADRKGPRSRLGRMTCRCNARNWLTGPGRTGIAARSEVPCPACSGSRAIRRAPRPDRGGRQGRSTDPDRHRRCRRFVKVDGIWYFAERKLLLDRSETRPPTPET